MTQNQTQALAIVSQDRELQVVTNRFGSLLRGDTREQECTKLVKLVNMGFDPRLEHLTVYEGRIWIKDVGIAWWKNHQDPDRRFGIICRPVKAADKALYGLGEDDIGVIAEVRDNRHGGVVIAEGFGKANPVKPYRGNPVEKVHPFVMAQKRAEGQAVKRAFPVGLDVGIIASEDAQTIVTIEAEPSPQPSASAGPRSWPNIGAFLNDCAKPPEEGFGWDRAKVLAVLGMKSQTDIVDLADAWNTLFLAHRRELSAEIDKVSAAQQ